MNILPDHFMISESDGGLYDTRKKDWASAPPLRHNYARFERRLTSGSGSIALRAAIRQKYSWPGGDDLIYITSDGGVLCGDCVRQEYRQIAYSFRHKINDGWQVVAVDTSAHYDEYICCDHCGVIIIDNEVDDA